MPNLSTSMFASSRLFVIKFNKEVRVTSFCSCSNSEAREAPAFPDAEAVGDFEADEGSDEEDEVIE